MRAANEIDFWRGLALVSIFANHIPGFYFERFTHRNLGFSDAAELFVFLAGYSLRRLVDGAYEPLGLGRLVLRLATRAVTLYAAQILITMLALGMIAAAALAMDNPLLLEWHNAAALFQDPARAHVGLILLTHQLGYFDILPLYVILMFGAPFLAVANRAAPRLVLPVSVLVYLATLVSGFNLPTWPVEGVWYFDPFAWQVVLVLGFTLAGGPTPAGAAPRVPPHLRWPALALVAICAALALTDFRPDPMHMPEPKLVFVLDKTYVTPGRLLHFLALVAAFAGSYRVIRRFLPGPALYLSMLGRNALNVFCVGSLLSLAGQIARLRFGGAMIVDGVILVGGLVALGFTAWISELRERLRLRPAYLPS
jgi:hypothetical protein